MDARAPGAVGEPLFAARRPPSTRRTPPSPREAWVQVHDWARESDRGRHGLDALLELGDGASALVTIGVMRRVAAGEAVDSACSPRSTSAAEAARPCSGLLVLAAIVLFCLFMPRANRNARAFGAPMSNSPGWAAGWFFVPVAFWWKPYYAMKEIWQGSDPDPTVHALQSRRVAAAAAVVVDVLLRARRRHDRRGNRTSAMPQPLRT